jgi:hypothetical protein
LPYIESLPQPHVNFIEEDMGVYSIFLEEDNNFVTPPPDPEDGMWHMHFDPSWRFLTRCTGALEGGGQLEDCVAEKGVHSLGLCRLGIEESWCTLDCCVC